MKKFISIFLSILIVLCGVCPALASGSNSAAQPSEQSERRSLKLLSIGNSFSEDAQRWLYQVAAAAGFQDITIANLYWGGCSLATHWSNANTNYAGYEYQKNTTGAIQRTAGVSIQTALLDEDWDFITLQQASGYSGLADTYNADLTNLIAYVKTYATNPNMQLGWHMTWAYQSDSTHGDFAKYNNHQMTMYNGIVNAVQTKILTNGDFSFVIPAGTAIQNLRTSFLGDTLTRDGYHMSYLLGRYTVSLTWIYTICQVLGLELPTDLTYTPSQTEVPLSYLPAIREAVGNAIQTPLAVTASTYPTLADTGAYTLLDWQPQVNAYWNSTDAQNYDVLTTTASNSKDFIASGVRFSREQLPVGSVIQVADGYQYRPEGWAALGQKNPYARPGNVSTASVTVTEAWWGSFQYRGFNLSHISSSLSGMTAEQAREILQIYVPVTPGSIPAGGNTVEDFRLLDQPCAVGENTISLAVIEGTDLSNLVPELTVSQGATVTPDPAQPQDFSRPVHYLVTSQTGHTNVYTVSVTQKLAIDPAKYTLLDWAPVFSTYWHSGGKAQLAALGSNSSYLASGRTFTRAEIPVGSIIEVDAGYQYRPEAWTDLDTATPSRPDVVSTAQVVVDEAWWGSYQYRAFNVSALNNPDLTGQQEAAVAAFRIYVPVGLVDLEKVNAAIAAIDSIPGQGSEDYFTAVSAAKWAYAALNPYEQAGVTNYAKLQATTSVDALQKLDNKTVMTPLSGVAPGDPEGYENLFDSDLGTKLCKVNVGTVAWKTDRPYAVAGYSLTTGNDSATWSGRSPAAWTLEGSLDNSNWVELDAVTNSGMGNVNDTEYPFVMANPGTYQYFRITFQEGKMIQLDELALYAQPISAETGATAAQRKEAGSYDLTWDENLTDFFGDGFATFNAAYKVVDHGVVVTATAASMEQYGRLLAEDANPAAALQGEAYKCSFGETAYSHFTYRRVAVPAGTSRYTRVYLTYEDTDGNRFTVLSQAVGIRTSKGD